MNRSNDVDTKTKASRKKHSAQFKDQSLEYAKKHGIRQAAKYLGLPESMLYSWGSAQRRGGQPLEQQKLQQAEFARLKRENSHLEEENSFLKKAAVDSTGHSNTSSSFSAGDKKFKVFLGLSFNSFAIPSNSA